jgi:hypothetical protein
MTEIVLLIAFVAMTLYAGWLRYEHQRLSRAHTDILANLPAIHDWQGLCEDTMHRYRSRVASWSSYSGPYSTENRERHMRAWDDLYETPLRKANSALDNITKAAGADPDEMVRPYDDQEKVLMRRRRDILDFVDGKTST